MNRTEFMNQLRRLLYDIPVRDRQEALDYYEAYFDDAGEDKEEAVIQELGSPGRIAAEIKAGLSPNPEAGEYTDTGYEDERFEDYEEHGQQPVRYKRYGENKEKGRKLLLLILLAIVTSPFWIAILGTIAGVLAGIGGALIGVFAGTLFGGIGLFIVGIAVMITGVMHMASAFALGLALFGLGMIMIAVGLLLLLAFGWLVRKAIPAVVRFVVDLIHRIVHRHRKEREE